MPDIASSGLEIVTGVFAIVVILRLTSRQLERARRLASAPPPIEPTERLEPLL